MTGPAIIRGDPNGLLALGPAELQDASRWQKRDSDILAHYLQVDAQLRRSKWYTSDKRVTTQGPKTLEVSMPDLEQFVFAAVYFRQFTLRKDGLLQDAVDRYCTHVACGIRSGWVRNEADAFTAQLDAPPLPLQVKNLTLLQLFDAFIYGAYLMHSISSVTEENRKRFLEIYDNQPLAPTLLALNVGMEMAMNHVSNIAVVIYQDFAHWQSAYSLPLPDVRWHDRVFDVQTDT